MAGDLSRTVQGELNYAIVDEVDNILVDEARTPLIISGQAEESTKLYSTFARLTARLTRDTDYTIDEQHKSVALNAVGYAKVEKSLNIDNLFDPEHYALTHYMDNALKARVFFERDKDYVVTDGEATIVDEFTGRLMPGRRYSDGLHQAIEAKEKLEIRRESVTLATITLQNYFRLYEKLSGMTGTAVTEAEEFDKIYKLDVVMIPTHQEMVREDKPDLIFRSEKGKFDALVGDLKELSESGRPVLVGTTSVEKSERLSEKLMRTGVRHEVLNAKHHEREAGIISQAAGLGPSRWRRTWRAGHGHHPRGESRGPGRERVGGRASECRGDGRPAHHRDGQARVPEDRQSAEGPGGEAGRPGEQPVLHLGGRRSDAPVRRGQDKDGDGMGADG